MAVEYYFIQGMVPGIVVLTCEPCLAFLHTSSGPYRAGVPGRMALVGSECVGRRRVVSRVLTRSGQRDAGSELEVGLEVGLPIGEDVRRWLKPELSSPFGEVGRSSRRAGVDFLGPGLPVGCWTVPLPCCF